MKLPIYLDYAATTPVDPRVAAEMMQCLTLDGNFGNPASRSHFYGRQAEQLVESARNNVAKLINATSREIIFTSGATESNNLAIKGVASHYAAKGKHIVTSKIEHKAVLDTCAQLEANGYQITYLDVLPGGLVDLDSLVAAFREDTMLVSVMHVNNELGVAQDIARIGELCRRHNILFHVDAAQSAGKLLLDMDTMKVDLLSLSAHKIYGPKGIGALYIRSQPKVYVDAQIHGGGHEQGIRSGTLAVHQIVGMGEAFRIAKSEMIRDAEHIAELRTALIEGLLCIDGLALNGDSPDYVQGIVNVNIADVDSDSLLLSLSSIALSPGSACNSACPEPSHVLRAIGATDDKAYNSFRLSIGRFTTKEEISYVVEHVQNAVNRLRELSPEWHAAQNSERQGGRGVDESASPHALISG